jgi:tRNA(fMet)-specific endonuclease VapC
LKYLLDTNACIAVINGRSAAVRARLKWEINHNATIGVPSVALFELAYGVAKGVNLEGNRRRLADFLASGVELIDFGVDDARAAGDVRVMLERTGRPIGPYDILIAGQALARDLILVTANQREFGRVKGLRWEDWAEGN